MTTDSYLDLLAEFGLSGSDDRPYLSPGIQDEASVLIQRLGDGTDLNLIWAELVAIVNEVNAYRGGLLSLLSYRTDRVAEPVPQSLTSEKFSEATEFGIPKPMGQDPVMLAGFTFKDYDLRSALTWKFARAASADQVRSQLVRALDADANLLLGTVLQRLFSPVEEVEESWGHVARGLWTGSDTFGPLPFNLKSFPTSHSHYLVSQGALLDSDDVETVLRLVSEHGYGSMPSQRLLLLCAPAEAEIVASFRAGATNNQSKVAKYDFVPSALAPPRITNESVIGATPSSTFAGLEVLGQYGRALVVEHNAIPAGYIAAVATGGLDAANNVIGLREHEQPEWRGLRLIPGLQPGFPLVDSNFMRSFGTGVRHRGGAAVLQIKASGTYDVPNIPA